MTQNRIPGDLDPIRKVIQESDFSKDPAEASSTKSFSSLMQNNLPEQQVNTTMINPLQLAQPATAGPTNPGAFLAQLQQAQNSMMNIKEHIKTPNLKLNEAQKKQIKGKLISANENLQAAHLKMGGTIEPKQESEEPSESGTGPIAQFLGYLTDGLNQLEETKRHVKTVSNDGMLAPADFLLIQLRLAKAQQELEFTGVLLSKTIDGFKQIMSVQL